MALYVQESCAEEQLRQGLMPSHFTLRRWQASQARLTACDDMARKGLCVEEEILAVLMYILLLYKFSAMAG
jgi:hypothetical protein